MDIMSITTDPITNHSKQPLKAIIILTLELMINRPDTERVGLFGYTGDGTKIINVGLLDVKVKGDYFVGNLVGRNWYGTITNSYATGDVEGSQYDIGGLVGGNGGYITNSYAVSTVTGSLYVGGLAGSALAIANITKQLCDEFCYREW